MKNNTNSDSSLQHYTIFCGVFLYQSRKPNQDLTAWTERLPDAGQFQQYISKTYYSNFINNIYLGRKEANARHNALLEHVTIKKYRERPATVLLQTKSEVLALAIDYLDGYLFTNGVGIFCFRVVFTNVAQATYANISKLNSSFRALTTAIRVNDSDTTVALFLKAELGLGLELNPDWERYLPQLKTYTVINDTTVDRLDASREELLFEISHAMPVGIIASNAPDKPNRQYIEQVWQTNGILVYDNWKAICLLDSFTRISCQQPDTFKTWELDFFHIYVHSLYCKFQLYYFNNQVNDLQLNQKTKAIRDQFIEFVNDYSLPYISYKFMPNLLYDKINQSLEIQKELDGMEKKVERLNATYQERKGKQLNALLLVLSLLSVAAVFNDVSQWLINMGVPGPWVYNPGFALVTISVLVLSTWLVFRKS